MTLQELFDCNWRHFIVERNRPGVDESTKISNEMKLCVYSNDDGSCKCAIGCALPSELAKKAERVGLGQISDDRPFGMHEREVYDEVLAHFAPITAWELGEIQSAHDGETDAEDFHAAYRAALIDFACKHGLAVPNCEANPCRA